MTTAIRPTRTIAALCASLLLLSACGGASRAIDQMPVFGHGLQPELVTRAVSIASTMNTQGKRVWCVPFARNASGIDIRGDAWTWWASAGDRGDLVRSTTPSVGAIMVFSKSSRLDRGHIAVVSEVVSDREIRLHHANWKRNKVSLDMGVIDVSDAGDWSRVRVESVPGAHGSPYPVSGFISRAF